MFLPPVLQNSTVPWLLTVRAPAAASTDSIIQTKGSWALTCDEDINSHTLSSHLLWQNDEQNASRGRLRAQESEYLPAEQSSKGRGARYSYVTSALPQLNLSFFSCKIRIGTSLLT